MTRSTQPHPMTGFFDSLTPEQQRDALAYRGCDSFGGPTIPRRKRRADVDADSPTTDSSRAIQEG